MAEYIKAISSEDLIRYWTTFFNEKITIKEINKMLEIISNTNFQKIINENKTINGEIIDSFVYTEIENEIYFQNILKNIKNKNIWIYFYEPILKKYIDNLINLVKKSNVIYDTDSFLSQSILSLVSELNRISYQTLIIEIHYAKKSNLLKGNTKEDRGTYFSDVLLKNNDFRKEIYLNYPELARILDLKTKHCIEYIMQITNDTSKELNNIENYLNNNNKLGKIKEIHMDQGDTHNNGKTVAQLIFDTNKIIIYKPHNLEIDKKFYDFIKWINGLNNLNNYKENLLAVKVYTIKNAGWAEFIEYKECDSKKDLKHFYYKIGKLLCLIHTLNGNDMHHENIIAHKDTPVLIDLETLMHIDLYDNYNSKSATEIAIKEIKESVISTHLLPSKVVNSKNNKVLEIGGVGATKNQKAPFKSKFIENIKSDEIKIVKRYGTIQPENNNPIYKGKTTNAEKYKKEIICGFKNMYTWIVKNKELYINKIYSLFNNSKIRILHKPTNVYAQLLYSSFHPDLLTNYADRYIFMHRIATDYANKNHNIVKCEINNMMQGDIPLFTLDVNNKLVHNIHLENININLNKTIMDKITKKIKKMDEIKMYRQIGIINTSFITEDYSGHIKNTIKFHNNTKRKYDDNSLVKISIKIADYMLQRSITSEKSGVKSRTWLGLEDTNLGFYMTSPPLTPNIYSGLSGIALFYNYLWKISKKYKYKEVLTEVIESILETLPQDSNFKNLDNINVSAFTGLNGVAYALFYIDNSNESNIYTNNILNILDILDCNIKNIGTKDIINDIGNLGILISIYEKTNINSIKNKSITICKKIFKKLNETKIKIKDKPGISWNEKGYVGYAHGNAGIIAQLYRLYNITKDENVLKLINEALLYERSMYSDKDKNWYRATNEKYFTCGWCHGAPGILLSKIQLKKLGYENKKINDEIITAIEKTIKDGLNNDISLCHGAMGNMVILKEAAIVLKDTILYDQTIATIEEILDFIIKLMETETFKENEHNEFMIGLSGIGYEILRIGKENEIPNILGLE